MRIAQAGEWAGHPFGPDTAGGNSAEEKLGSQGFVLLVEFEALNDGEELSRTAPGGMGPKWTRITGISRFQRFRLPQYRLSAANPGICRVGKNDEDRLYGFRCYREQAIRIGYLLDFRIVLKKPPKNGIVIPSIRPGKKPMGFQILPGQLVSWILGDDDRFFPQSIAELGPVGFFEMFPNSIQRPLPEPDFCFGGKEA